MKTIGVIGFGRFGQFLVEKLSPHFAIKAYDKNTIKPELQTTLADVAQSDFIFLAIPLSAYRDVLTELKPLLRPETVVIDICSVKEKPVRILQELLPNQPIVATHPLFGPESAKESIAGHRLVVCPEVSDPVACQAIQMLAQIEGLKIINLSMAEHDEAMAVVQGLTFFIAHALKDFELHREVLNTPSFQKLLDLAELEKHHSQDLFYTIQAGNERTKQVRTRFMTLIDELDNDIKKHKYE